MSAVTDTVAKAIYDWVVAGSGLAAAQVIWADQRGKQPSGCYIAMRIENEREFGADWEETSTLAQSDDDDVEVAVHGVRVATLVLECFAAGDPWSTAKPERRLRSVLTARRLPTVRFALRAANVGIGPVAPVQTLAIERAQLFEPRARVEVTLHLASVAAERSTWIETVKILPEVDGIQQPEITVVRPPDE